MYAYELTKNVEKTFFKLTKKNPSLLKAIEKKIDEICEDPKPYKNLHAPLQHLRRVHIGSFVLVFSIDEKRRMICFEDFAHHDTVYER